MRQSSSDDRRGVHLLERDIDLAVAGGEDDSRPRA
jgi:hypothetical protein